MLGTPWLSRALGEYVSDAAQAGARVVTVDPWQQWADPRGQRPSFTLRQPIPG